MKMQSLIDEADVLRVKFEAASKATSNPAEARVAAMAASDMHSILTRWYGWEQFAQ